MPRRVGQVRARAQDLRPGDRPLPAGPADDRAHVARLRDLPASLFQGRVDEEHRSAAHAPGLDGQAVRDRRGVQRRARRGRGARCIRLFGRVPGRAFPAQRARADHLRGDARGAHDPAGRVRPRLSRGPARQEVAAALPAGLKVAAVAAVGAPQRRLNHLDFIVLSLYWVAIGYLWNSLTALILPDMIIHFVGQAHEGVAASFLKSIGSIGVVLLTTMLATVVLVPDRAAPVERQFRNVREMLVATFGVPLRHRAFLWLMASRLLIFMGFGGLQNFAFFYFDNVFFHHNPRATAAATSTLLGISIAVAALVTWPASRLSDRVGRRPRIFVAGLVGAAGTLVLVFSHYQWVPDSVVGPLARALHVPDLAAQATLTGLVIGIGLGMFFSVDWAFIQDIIPADQGGLYMGFSNIATAGAGIIAVFVGGPLLDAFNAGPKILGLPGGFPVIFAVFVLLFVIGSLSILKVPERRVV